MENFKMFFRKEICRLVWVEIMVLNFSVGLCKLCLDVFYDVKNVKDIDNKYQGNFFNRIGRKWISRVDGLKKEIGIRLGIQFLFGCRFRLSVAIVVNNTVRVGRGGGIQVGIFGCYSCYFIAVVVEKFWAEIIIFILKGQENGFLMILLEKIFLFDKVFI